MCLDEKSLIRMDDSIHTLNLLDSEWLDFAFYFLYIWFCISLCSLFQCSEWARCMFMHLWSYAAGALNSLSQTASLVNSLQTVQARCNQPKQRRTEWITRGQTDGKCEGEPVEAVGRDEPWLSRWLCDRRAAHTEMQYWTMSTTRLWPERTCCFGT